MAHYSVLHCQCTHPLAAKRRTSETQSDPGRTFYNCPTQQCHFFLWEDELPSLPSPAQSTAAEATTPTGAPPHSAMLPLSPRASPILMKRRISVLEANEDPDKPPKRVKVAGAASENPSGTPPAGQELSPGSTSSGGWPARRGPETVDDDGLPGSDSSLDKAPETDLNPGGRSLRAAPILPGTSSQPVSSPFFDALHPPTAHIPSGIKRVQYQEDMVDKHSKSSTDNTCVPHSTNTPPASHLQHALSSAPRSSQSQPDPSPSVSPPRGTPVSKEFTLGDIDEMIKSRKDIAGDMEVRAAELMAVAGRLKEQGRQLEALKVFVMKGARGSNDEVGTAVKIEKGEGGEVSRFRRSEGV